MRISGSDFRPASEGNPIISLEDGLKRTYLIRYIPESDGAGVSPKINDDFPRQPGGKTLQQPFVESYSATTC